MANRERGELSVTVGGRAYTLRPTYDAMCELETLVDKNFDEIIAQVRNGRMSGLRAIVWAALYDHHNAEIRTLKDASEWIERAGGVGAVTAWFVELEALNGAEHEGGEQANPPTAQSDGIGEPSGPPLVASV